MDTKFTGKSFGPQNAHELLVNLFKIISSELCTCLLFYKAFHCTLCVCLNNKISSAQQLFHTVDDDGLSRCECRRQTFVYCRKFDAVIRFRAFGYDGINTQNVHVNRVQTYCKIRFSSVVRQVNWIFTEKICWARLYLFLFGDLSLRVQKVSKSNVFKWILSWKSIFYFVWCVLYRSIRDHETHVFAHCTVSPFGWWQFKFWRFVCLFCIEWISCELFSHFSFDSKCSELHKASTIFQYYICCKYSRRM